MATDSVKILGISGTPIEDGNCDKFVAAVLAAASEIEGVETEFVTLADKKIAPCNHCQWCMENRSRCKIKDDVHAVHDKMFEADGVIFGGPTYNLVVSTQLVNLFSRGREEIFIAKRMSSRGIPGTALTLGWFGTGMENAQDNIKKMMESWGLFPIGFGSAITSTAWKGESPRYQENGALDDLKGVFLAQELAGRRLAKVAKMLKYARDAGMDARYSLSLKKQ